MKDKVNFDTSEGREVCRDKLDRTSQTIFKEFGLDGVCRVN